MTARKPKPMHIRDERGRFAHASPEVRAGLEAMRGRTVLLDEPIPFERVQTSMKDAAWLESQSWDAIYRPERKSVLRRAIDWLKWHPR